MNRQIIFTPEKEASRDLTYSEYSSCGQSIHILFQDKALDKYEFLLNAYRAAISAYLSFHKIESPARFLRALVTRFDALAREAKLAPGEYQNFGAHIVINTGRMLWLLSSDERSVCIGSAGRYVSCADASRNLVSEITVVDGGGQTELFPNSIRDYMRLFAIRPPENEAVDIVMGCGEGERDAVFESLQAISPRMGAPGGPLKQYIPLKHVSRKVIAITLPHRSEASEAAITPGIPMALAGASHRNIPAITLYAILIATVVIAVLWGVHKLTGDRPDGRVTMEAGIAPGAEPVAAPEAGRRNEAEPSDRAASPAAPIELALLWDRAFKMPVTSSPAGAGEAVVFGCRDGNLYALHCGSGEVAWKFASSAGIGASPAVSGERVVCADYDGNVFCLGAGGGSPLWNRKLPGKVSSSPLIIEQKAVVGCYDGYVYCLALGTGDLLWRFRTGGMVRATPVSNGALVMIPSYDGVMYALALGTGVERWRHVMQGNLDSSPALGEGRVIVGCPDGTIHALDQASGSLLWKATTSGPVKSGIAIAASRVYSGSNDGHLYCLALETGTIIWKFKTGGIVLARPCVAGNLAFVGSYDGAMYVLNADTGEKIDSYATNAQIFSSPLFNNDAVYFGNNEGMAYCLRLVRKNAS